MIAEANAPVAESLTFYVVYHSPLDFPGEWVIRRHHLIGEGEVLAEPELWARGTTLEAVRLSLPLGLFHTHRHPGDDTSIEEVWL